MYFIKEKDTELYYRDYILNKWEDMLSNAHIFTFIEDAKAVKKALNAVGFESVEIKPYKRGK